MPCFPWRLPARAVAILLPLFFVSAFARADAEPIRLTYRGTADCPSETRFVHEVMARTERARRATSAEASRAFDAAVIRESATIRGLLTITNLDGSQSKREITGDRCDEVVSALALITALAIDPLARETPQTSIDVTPTSNPDTSAPPPPPSLPRSGLPPDAPLASLGPPSSPVPASTEAAVYKPPARMRWAIGAAGHLLGGLLPTWRVGGGAFVDLAGTSTDVVVPSFRVSMFAVTAHLDFTSTVGTELDWFVARLEGCPLRFRWQPPWSFSLCAALDAGVLRSSGAGLTTRVADSRPWLAPAALGRLTWSSPTNLFVEGGGGVSVQTTRYSFYFQQGGVSQPSFPLLPLFAATLTLDAGYRFP